MGKAFGRDRVMADRVLKLIDETQVEYDASEALLDDLHVQRDRIAAAINEAFNRRQTMTVRLAALRDILEEPEAAAVLEPSE